MSELFEIEPSLSPRLKWIREHEIMITKITDCAYDPPKISYRASKQVAIAAEGEGSDDAVINLAKKLNLKLWNE